MTFKYGTVAGILLLAGCASIVHGTSQTIMITTPPTSGANCVLTNREGNWNVSSPGMVTVSKSSQNIAVTCTKDGWEPAFAAIPANYDDLTTGSALLGSFIGLGIDASTGALNNYPKAFQIPMTPLPGATEASEH